MNALEKNLLLTILHVDELLNRYKCLKKDLREEITKGYTKETSIKELFLSPVLISVLEKYSNNEKV